MTRRSVVALIAASTIGAETVRGAGVMEQDDSVRELDRIDRWVAAHAPQTGPMFRPGTSVATIAEAERLIGVTFPDALRAVFAHADGQPDGAPTVSDSFRLMSVADAVDAALFLNDFFPRGSNDENPDHDPIEADPGLRAVWWRKGRIPVFANGGGDYYCVDTEPASNGVTGQVVSYWHDESRRGRVESSLAAMLAGIADGLEAGAYELRDGMIGERLS